MVSFSLGLASNAVRAIFRRGPDRYRICRCAVPRGRRWGSIRRQRRSRSCHRNDVTGRLEDREHRPVQYPGEPPPRGGQKHSSRKVTPSRQAVCDMGGNGETERRSRRPSPPAFLDLGACPANSRLTSALGVGGRFLWSRDLVVSKPRGLFSPGEGGLCPARGAAPSQLVTHVRPAS